MFALTNFTHRENQSNGAQSVVNCEQFLSCYSIHNLQIILLLFSSLLVYRYNFVFTNTLEDSRNFFRA